VTPSGIEPATVRLVAHSLNQLRRRVPPNYDVIIIIIIIKQAKLKLSLELAMKAQRCNTDVALFLL
jgi:hypothetical protein